MEHWILFVFLLRIPCCWLTKHYYIHKELKGFEDALQSCTKGTHLTDMRDEDTVSSSLLPAVSQALQSNGTFIFWIGLKKPKSICFDKDKPLKGFMWTVNNSTDSKVSQWKKEPSATCTVTRCGSLSVDYNGTSIIGWGLEDQKCSANHMFICSKLTDFVDPIHFEKDAKFVMSPGQPFVATVYCPSRKTSVIKYSQTDGKWRWENGSAVENRQICNTCLPGYNKTSRNTCDDIDECKSKPCAFRCNNTEGSYFCTCSDGYVLHDDGRSCAKVAEQVINDAVTPESPNSIPSQLPRSDKTSPPSDGLKMTTPTADSQTGNNKFSIFKPVLIALSILVALVVIVLIIVKCCLMRKSKTFGVKKGKISKEEVDLKGVDSEDHEEDTA